MVTRIHTRAARTIPVAMPTIRSQSRHLPSRPTPRSRHQLSPRQSVSLTRRETCSCRGTTRGALDSINKAIQKSPTDAVLHEFRALCQFALGQYKPAAATLYAVLSAGPGWDWTTLISLYPGVEVYTAQLRALEKYTRENPKSLEGHFALAYQYLTSGSKDAAAGQYKKVLELNPNDTLSRQLLKSLTGSTGEPPKAGATAAPANPIHAGDLVGNWKASRPGGSEIALNIAKDNKYTWKYTVGGKTQVFSGAYTLADNVLILKENDQPMMVGEVRLPATNQMNFMVAGGDPSDPGLSFSR